MITDAQIRRMFPNAGARLDAHISSIEPALDAAMINTPQRIAAFLAQLAAESAEFRYLEEIADGSEYEGRDRSDKNLAQRAASSLVSAAGFSANRVSRLRASFVHTPVINSPSALTCEPGPCFISESQCP